MKQAGMTNEKLTMAALKARLRQAAARIDKDPQVNSVFSVGQALFCRLEESNLTLEDLGGVINEVHLELAQERAIAIAEQHRFQTGETAYAAQLSTYLQTLASKGFEAYRAAVEEETGGIVFTAHPTYALSHSARMSLAAQATDPSDTNTALLAKRLEEDARDWSASISLPDEHDEVQDALNNAAQAMSAYGRAIVETARAHTNGEWRTLRPSLPTLASWVGYDLDGRTDIHWSQSITFRLSEKALQLSRYAARLDGLATEDGSGEVARLARLARRAAEVSAQEATLFSGNLTEADTLIKAANALTAEQPDRMTDIEALTEPLSDLIGAAQTGDDLAAALILLRAEMDALQLGTARIHLRLNAAQIRTVINRDLGLETEDRDLGRLALKALSEKANTSAVRKVSFADLFLEQSTARRQFMMCAQILKHIDAGSVIRFLIAESENPATVMGALYLARQYGVADSLDISPLFETPEALETAGRFIERLLEEPSYVEYVRRRGYVSIQLGFSDAGRFIGQVAANMAIERIQNLISAAVAEKCPGLGLLIFNTHGESIGRGAFPGTFEQRFNHALTPWVRNMSAARHVPLRHEVSFQGGDGYLHFANPQLAEATYSAWALAALSDAPPTDEDAFYKRRDFVWDFYRSLRQFHERLFGRGDYARLLSDFGTGLLIRAGSRVRRRSGTDKGPRTLRAISHNATLQQLGVPINSSAGIGSAVRRETDRLVEVADTSARMRDLMTLAVKARVMTSLPALRAYASVYDPSVWVSLSQQIDQEHATPYRRLYYLLQDHETTSALNTVANLVAIDLRKFDHLIARMKGLPDAAERHESRLNAHVLHAVRIALMMKALVLAGRLPAVSLRYDISVRDIERMIAEMRIGEAVETLCEIYPKTQDAAARFNAVTEEGYNPDDPESLGYDRLHNEIIAPLDMIHRMLHTTTLAIGQGYRAYG